MNTSTKCESCGMPITAGPYCQYCVDENGQLEPFETRFQKMVNWVLDKDSALPRAEAEEKTRNYMRTMPAWKDHPALAS